MRETLITFETAKLVKEKGFNIPHRGFNHIGELHPFQESYIEKYLNIQYYYAPTQSLLQKWLREVHNLHIGVEPETFNPETDYISEIIMLPRNFLKYRGKTYEEALEIALKSALILVKDELVK